MLSKLAKLLTIALCVMVTVLACVPETTDPDRQSPPTAFPKVLQQCQNNAAQGGWAFVKNASISCGSNVVVRLGTGSLTSLQRDALNLAISGASGAVATWNNAIPDDLNLPNLATGSSGGIAINITSVSTNTNCADTEPGSTVIVIRSTNCNGNYVAFSQIKNLIIHELAHVIGFDGGTWHSSQADSVAGNCASHLPEESSSINSTVCNLEVEVILAAYGVRTAPLDIHKHVISGLRLQPASLSLAAGTSSQVSVAELLTDSPICGGIEAAPSVSGSSVTPCELAGSDGTFAWSSNGSNVTVSATGNPVTVTAGATTSGATISANATSVGPHQLSSFFIPGSLVVSVYAANVMAIYAGNNQTVNSGSVVPVKPAVRILNAGQPVSGVTVTFAVTGGGGSVTSGTQVTGANGVATVGNWTLGVVAGPNALQAAASGVVGSPVTFSATGTVGTLSINGGDNQAATVNTTVPVAPSVKIRSAANQPVAGRTVTFAVASGGGSITGATQVTNASGIATVGSWTMGPSAGLNTLTATSALAGGSPLTISATGLPVGGLVAPQAFHLAACSTFTYNGKLNVNYTLEWTPGAGNPVGTRYEVGESNSSNPGTAAITFNGVNGNSVIANYTVFPYSQPRYFWVRHNVLGGGAPTTWAILQENPLAIADACEGVPPL